MKFLINSNILNKLEPEIKIAIDIIKRSINNKTPIIIRHHADTDGYCAAIALERAILPLIYDKHTRERDMFHYYKRLPIKTPFYNYTDATKDVANFLTEISRFGQRTPLIIIVDCGSSEQSLASIKKAKLYGAKIMVIDHHPPTKEIDNLTKIHVNPHLINSTDDLTAGMLCAEIANSIIKNEETLKDFEFIAAVSGFGDKCTSNEQKQYIELAEKENYTKEFIKNISAVLDFEAFYLNFIESREIINDILGADPKKQKELVNIILPLINNKLTPLKLSIEKYAEIENKPNLIIAKIDSSKIKDHAEYPSMGKVGTILREQTEKQYKKPTIALNITKTSISFRSSTEIKDFDVHKIIETIKKEIPHSNIDGGGHRVAGSIRFIEASFDEVIKTVNSYINNLK